MYLSKERPTAPLTLEVFYRERKFSTSIRILRIESAIEYKS